MSPRLVRFNWLSAGPMTDDLRRPLSFLFFYGRRRIIVWFSAASLPSFWSSRRCWFLFSTSFTFSAITFSSGSSPFVSRPCFILLVFWLRLHYFCCIFLPIFFSTPSLFLFFLTFTTVVIRWSVAFQGRHIIIFFCYVDLKKTKKPKKKSLDGRRINVDIGFAFYWNA